MFITCNTSLGTIKGNAYDDYNEFLGLRYATAERFCYAVPVDSYADDITDATVFGGSCPQTRTYYEHLEIPERAFYHHEYREGLTFHYTEDCLNLNIYAPKEPSGCPVLLYIHGGGFNSGASCESHFDGAAYAKRDVIVVTINYRVGVLGYLTHKSVRDTYGHNGNFGLDDQLTAIKWVKRHIADFGGDPENITLMGQSAGAISIQYLCLNKDNKGLFQRAILLSGAGLFPKFSLPRPAKDTEGYWKQLMELLEVSDFEQLRTMELSKLFAGIEQIKSLRKDNTYNTMPVVDEYLIPAPIDTLMDSPLPIPYMVGYTNNDMYAILMSHIAHKYARQTNAYLYYFDIDAPGDDHNGAFHTCDMRYVFGTLERSHRPYTDYDYEIADCMMDYIANFAKVGNPNDKSHVRWTRGGRKALCISKKGIRMGRPNRFKLLWNTLTKGDPK